MLVPLLLILFTPHSRACEINVATPGVLIQSDPVQVKSCGVRAFDRSQAA